MFRPEHAIETTRLTLRPFTPSDFGDLYGAIGWHRIIGCCDARNRASARLMERIGMRREARFVHNQIVKALRDIPLVSLPRGTGVRAALDAACAAAGFEPRIVFEASALPMVVTMAAQGLGLAVVPESVANTPPAPAAPVIVPITPETRSRLELAWPATPSANPAARVLIQQARALGSPGRPAS